MLKALPQAVVRLRPIVVAEQQAADETIPLMEPSAWPYYIES